MARPAAMTAQQLRDVRHKYDLTTADLMLAMHLSRSMVYYLLAGRRRMTLQHVKSLHAYIDTHWFDFMKPWNQPNFARR